MIKFWEDNIHESIISCLRYNEMVDDKPMGPEASIEVKLHCAEALDKKIVKLSSNSFLGGTMKTRWCLAMAED